MEFSRSEYWSSRSLLQWIFRTQESNQRQAGSLPAELPGKPWSSWSLYNKNNFSPAYLSPEIYQLTSIQGELNSRLLVSKETECWHFASEALWEKSSGRGFIQTGSTTSKPLDDFSGPELPYPSNESVRVSALRYSSQLVLKFPVRTAVVGLSLHGKYSKKKKKKKSRNGEGKE